MKRLESLPVQHLFFMELDTDPPIDTAGGPQGHRVIAAVTGGRFEGDRLRGRVVAPSGDWLTLRPNGSMKLDVRLMLETDDDARIYVSYCGIVTPSDDGHRVRSTPLFETGDDRYAWLNDLQAVGIGEISGATVRYHFYELQ